MGFKAKTIHGSIFKKVIDAMKDLVQDANFDCSPAGISLQAMDTSHGSLISLNLRHDSFELYRCDKNISLGMNLIHLSKMLKCGGTEDSITIKAVDGEDKVTFLLESPSKDRTSNFEIKQSDIDTEHLKMEKEEDSADVKMSSTEFQRICRDLSSIGDSVVLTIGQGFIRFSTSGIMGLAHITLMQNQTNEKKDEVSIVLKGDEEISTGYALRFLNSFAKATPLCSYIKLTMSKGMPVGVEYKIEDMGQIRFYLAPRMDEAS